MSARWLPVAAVALLLLAGVDWLAGAYPVGLLPDLAATTIVLHTPASAAGDGLAVPPVPGVLGMALPLMPGAQPVPPMPGMSWTAGISGDPYVKVGFSTVYRVPMGLPAAEAWVGSGLSELGYTEVGAFSGSSNVDSSTAYTVHQREYVRPRGVSQPPALLVVNMRRLGPHASLLRYIASVLEQPPRPLRTRIVGPVQAIVIRERTGGRRNALLVRRVATPAAVARITAALNGLSTVSVAPFMCPKITYTIRMTLMTRTRQMAVSDMDNCGAVEVQGVWFSDPHQMVNRALRGLGLKGTGG